MIIFYRTTNVDKYLTKSPQSSTYSFQPHALSLSAQEQQLQQLQLLQEQLVRSSQLLSQPQPQHDQLDEGGLLSQIQKLTHQLLAEDKQEAEMEEEPRGAIEPSFNKVRGILNSLLNAFH